MSVLSSRGSVLLYLFLTELVEGGLIAGDKNSRPRKGISKSFHLRSRKFVTEVTLAFLPPYDESQQGPGKSPGVTFGDVLFFSLATECGLRMTEGHRSP